MSDLCRIPDVNIDEDDGRGLERGRAYLQSVLDDGRRASPGSMVVQFGFDMAGGNHAHGSLYIVKSERGSTIVWELTGGQEKWESGARSGRRGRACPSPVPGQFVVDMGVGLGHLTGEDILTAIASIMADRIMGG